KMGKPRLFFGVSAGNMDSMVNHYTAMKRLRSDDAYTPGGRSGYRPDYPTIVYTHILKELFPDVPVVAGGVEASMRRLAHYDYWNDRVDPSILISSRADMLVYGMGEQPVRQIARLMKKGVPFSSLVNIEQTVISVKMGERPPAGDGSWRNITIPSYEEVKKDKQKFSEAFVAFEKESNRINSARIFQETGERVVVVIPPCAPASTEEIDSVYDLPYTRLPHPRYNRKPPIPAFEMIKNSVNIHRGCFGGCSFCAISAHQGKQVVSRSEESVMREIEQVASMPGFNGVLTDLGGPSANMYCMKGKELSKCLNCVRPSCIWPSICNNLETDHGRLVALYSKAREFPGIKRVYIGSGVRYDLLLSSFNRKAGRNENNYLTELLRHHVSGRLKLPPNIPPTAYWR
ncbi:MAG: YgiQ family radical SAM protein, partial [Bacteroidales bacterium]